MTWNPARKTIPRRTAIHGVRLLCVCAIPLLAQEGPPTLLTEEWAPYNYTEQGVLTGYSVEIVQAILKDLRIDAPIQVLPGMRASLMLNRDPRTMIITMLRTPGRETQYKWIGPLGDGAIYFYKRKGNPVSIASLEDAKKVQRVACRNAGLVRNLLREKGFSNLDPSAPDGESVYRKLLADRCDLGISDAPLGVKHLLKKWKLPLDTLVQTSVKIVESPIFIACSKDIPDAEIAKWQASLDRLKASASWSAIRRKYGE